MPTSEPELTGGRLVVVLGYSAGRATALHPVCAARLSHAAVLAAEADAVLLSGWSRRRGAPSEAELMRRAWPGRALRLLSDPDARATAENAAHAVARAAELAVGELVVVTSWWHRLRTRILFAALGAGVPVTVVGVRNPSPPRALLRELAVFGLLPLQIALARRRVNSIGNDASSPGVMGGSRQGRREAA